MAINLEQINSGNDYANVLIEQMQQNRIEAKAEGIEDMPNELFDIWCNGIRECCIDNYNEYIIGKYDTFMMSDAQMTKAYNDAIHKYAEQMITQLYETEMIEVTGVDKNGDILYGLSDTGKDIMREYGDRGDDE